MDFISPVQQYAKPEPIETAALNADLMDHLLKIGFISDPKLL